MDTASSAIKIMKDICRKTLPLSIRRSSWIVELKRRLYWYNLIYDADYCDCNVRDPAIHSVGTICESIYNEFKPRSVIDVGCGTGALLDALRKRGCDVLGLEYSEAALHLCRAQHLPVLKFNLERDTFTDKRVFDVAISMEVAEHLPAIQRLPQIADRYVNFLTRLSPVIVFTAAPPAQGGRVGTDHVNEHPPSYWITKFHQRGFKHDEALSRSWSEKWKVAGDVALCYYQNLMIFRQTQ
jgi:SAM-dependent methyltransferase